MTTQSPPKDRLQQLLAPLQNLSEEEAYDLDPEGQQGNGLLTDQLLAFDPSGLPLWWPTSGSQPDRRRALLEKIDETLPADYQPNSETPTNRRQLVRTLRLIASELT